MEGKLPAVWLIVNCKNGVSSYERQACRGRFRVVNHAVEYVNGNVHTNGMENVWALLKGGT